MACITLENVHLTFRARARGSVSLKDLALQLVLRRPAPPIPVVNALRGVSFEVNEGERLGIIGHNGAGKSSLLRVLAGVYRPSQGVCKILGSVSSLFELALGFEPDASGWDNIRYRGYLQKETPRSIQAKTQAIAEFSELGSALDMPIRYYSSGMLVRLAFSIATAVDPEILLIDEVLAAGDLAFQEKARRRVQDMMSRARAIVMVSHDLGSMARMCDRMIWLHQGEIRQSGPARDTILAYTQYMKEQANRVAAGAAA